MASFASSATTCGARKHAWTKSDKIYWNKHVYASVRTCLVKILVRVLDFWLIDWLIPKENICLSFWLRQVRTIRMFVKNAEYQLWKIIGLSNCLNIHYQFLFPLYVLPCINMHRTQSQLRPTLWLSKTVFL